MRDGDDAEQAGGGGPDAWRDRVVAPPRAETQGLKTKPAPFADYLPRDATEERFAQLYVELKNADIAWYEAAGRRITRRSLQAKLARMEPYLRDLATQKRLAVQYTTQLGASDVLRELGAIARFNYADYVIYDPDTQAYRMKPFHLLSREQAAAIDGIEILDSGALVYRLPRIKDKAAALVKIGEASGLWLESEVERSIHGAKAVGITFANTNTDALINLERQMLRLLGPEVARKIIGPNMLGAIDGEIEEAGTADKGPA